MADIAVQNITAEGGDTVTFTAAAAGGDKFIYDAQTCILIRNNDASAKTVTVSVPAANVSVSDNKFAGVLAKQNIAITVPANGIGFIPPLPPIFRNAADLNKVALTYSAVTSLLVAFVKDRP